MGNKLAFLPKIIFVLLFFSCGYQNLLDYSLTDSHNAYISITDQKTFIQNVKKGLIPIAIKDNIDVIGFPNTAGSIALKNNFPKEDAFVIQKLKKNGFFISGKANLSEWANFRSTSSTSGWSSMGGQTINPYGVNRNPCGSSSGSAVAVATDLVNFAIGTETNGSISCPSSVNGVVGIKPTVGLVSRSGIIPISYTQDTAGPIANNVYNAAKLLEIISGYDPNDVATHSIPKDFDFGFARDLDSTSLQSVRIGLLNKTKDDKKNTEIYNIIRDVLKRSGAEIVQIEDDRKYPGKEERLVLLYEFRIGIENYLNQANSPFKTLQDLIDFNIENSDSVMKYFDQSRFIESEKTSSMKKEYEKALKAVMDSRRQIDQMLKKNNVEVIIGITRGPAWEIDHVGGDRSARKKQRSLGSMGSFAAMAGYPHITIPLTLVDDLPIGISFIGSRWSDKKLIELAYSFEVANKFFPKPKDSK